jgi:hypothetical protein
MRLFCLKESEASLTSKRKQLPFNFIDVQVSHIVKFFIIYFPADIAMLSIPVVGCQVKNYG